MKRPWVKTFNSNKSEKWLTYYTGLPVQFPTHVRRCSIWRIVVIEFKLCILVCRLHERSLVLENCQRIATKLVRELKDEDYDKNLEQIKMIDANLNQIKIDKLCKFAKPVRTYQQFTSFEAKMIIFIYISSEW